jgi:hypothetical protein
VLIECETSDLGNMLGGLPLGGPEWSQHTGMDRDWIE